MAETLCIPMGLQPQGLGAKGVLAITIYAFIFNGLLGKSYAACMKKHS